jgi:hypothetical protein
MCLVVVYRMNGLTVNSSTARLSDLAATQFGVNHDFFRQIKPAIPGELRVRFEKLHPSAPVIQKAVAKIKRARRE